MTVVGHETRPARCERGHITTAEVELHWNPWGEPDGAMPGPAWCHCGARKWALARADVAALSREQA